jgi:translation initiation factor 2-alpha kinase 4
MNISNRSQVFIDAANNPRIGDFGLATSGHKAIDLQHEGSAGQDDDLTRDVGTAMYVAPELRSKGGVSYTDKIDMYSLGIMLFEMCYPLATGMERMQVLTGIREREHKLPAIFDAPDKALQAEVITSLITHRPSERPSSTQLVQSDKIPMQVEDETIRLALKGLADESSPYHQRIISALFSEGKNSDVKAQLYDSKGSGPATNFLLLQGLIKEKLTACFRCHGAIEVPRHGLLPRSEHYNANTVVRLLDVSGTMVQLPHDLTLPMARLIARQGNVAEKSFMLSTVYRNAQRGVAPRSVREADFDIVCTTTKDLTLHEAEVIKVLDEVTDIFPSLRRAQMCFHISHGSLLDIILDFCRINAAQRSAVKEVLGRLNVGGTTWAKIRLELRSATIGISTTSLEELSRFDFRETPEICLTKVQAILHGSHHIARVNDVFTRMIGLVEYCQRLGVKRRIFFSPLSNYNEHFYQNGIMFQLLFDNKKRDVVAGGGRYDSLVAEFRPRILGVEQPSAITHAVGFNLAWDLIVSSMLRYLKDSTGGSAFLKKGEEQDTKSSWTTRRCDVLIGSIEPSVLRSTGLSLVAKLWAHDISAELAADVQTTEELITRYREEKHSWIVTVKHEDIASNKPDLRVKSIDTNTDHDVRSPDLVNFLRAEIRERDQREGTDRAKMLNRQSSHHTPADAFGSSSTSRDVQVLLANHKSKKGNKWRIVEQAQQKVPDLLRSYAEGPIACVETRDEIVEMIRETRLSDADSWRRVVQAPEVNLNERAYVQEIWEMLKAYKMQHADANGQRNCFVYNFRSGLLIVYDLCL